MKKLAFAALVLVVFVGAVVGATTTESSRSVPVAGQRPTFQIGGRLVEEGTNAPLAGRVIASQFRRDGTAALIPVRVGEDGDFVFRELENGPTTLVGIADGHGRTVQVVTVDVRGVQEVVLALPRALTIEGTVVDSNRRPVAGAEVAVEYVDRLGARLARKGNTPLLL